MKFTLSWLKAHLSTDADAEVIADKLTAIGIEVESMIDIGKLYKPFVIGHILEAVPHPNADRLRVCTVDNGRERLQIVCGALNARAGIKVVLAPIGAVIPSGNFEIKAAKIRGVESCGMLCSGEELLLDLGPKDGIIELPEDAVVGVNFAEWYGLNDIFFDVALTPNRGDAASVHGIARDLYAAGIGTLKVGKHYEVRKEEVWPLSIEDKEGCAEFSLAYIKGVNNKVYT